MQTFCIKIILKNQIWQVLLTFFNHKEEHIQVLAFLKEKFDLFCSIKVNNAVLLGKSKLVKQNSKQQFFYRQITASHEKFSILFLQISNLTDFPQIFANLSFKNPLKWIGMSLPQ